MGDMFLIIYIPLLEKVGLGKLTMVHHGGNFLVLSLFFLIKKLDGVARGMFCGLMLFHLWFNLYIDIFLSFDILACLLYI